jgi:hypothetical protein
MLTNHLALVSKSKSVSMDELNEVAAAIQTQITRDLQPIWNTQATISVFKDLKSVPTGYWPIVIMDNIHQQGAGGYHSDKNNQPFALILADADWIIATSHETIEMLVDPWGNRTVTADSLKAGQGRVLYLVEACDPCESGEFAYSVNGIKLTDFITPHYHDPVTSASVRYSFTGSIKKPRQVLSGGYISWFDPESKHIWQAVNQGNDLEFRDLGASPGGFSLREFVDLKVRQIPDLIAPYSKGFEANKIFGNTDATTRRKSSEAAASIWEEDIERVTKK